MSKLALVPSNFLIAFLYVFIYLLLCYVFIAVCGLSLFSASRGYSLSVVCGLLIVEASLVAEHGALGHMGFSSCGSGAPEHRLRSCGKRA